MPNVRTLLLALLFTWVIEWATAAAILRRSNARLAYYTLLINAFTNPLANFAYGTLTHEREMSVFVLIEVAIVLVEVPMYRSLLNIPWKTAGVISVVGNGLSAACSFLL